MKRENLEFVSKELNKKLSLDPPIDTSEKINDKMLMDDITDVFENVLLKTDKLSKKTEKILSKMGLNREETLPEEIETKPEKQTEIKKETKTKKPKTNIKKFVLDGLKAGTFEGLKNKEIAEIARDKFGSKTSAGTIAVYKCELKKGKND